MRWTLGCFLTFQKRKPSFAQRNRVLALCSSSIGVCMLHLSLPKQKNFVAICRLMQRLLEDLVDCGSVTYEAIQDWQHDKDAENTDINN